MAQAKKRITLKKVDEYSLLNKYFKMYCIELAHISGEAAKKPPTLNRNKIRDDYFIYNERNEMVGFCLISHHPASYSDKDVYVMDFCIFPKFRHRRYGTLAAKELSKKYKGFNICLSVLKGNDVGAEFWKQTMTDKQNYKEVFVPYVSNDNSLIFHYYKKPA